jgi:TolB-like protein/DNA-binding winged helix-turn-helix (wHTH) protein
MPPQPPHDNGTAPPRFRVGDLEIDIGKAEVTRGDEKVALPKLSFDMLCALINAAPAIVTNDELLSQVWPGLQVSPESVSQCVKRLRSAIGDDSQQPRYILGVRGRGYRLIPVPERLTESRPPTTSDAVNLSIDTPSLTMADGPTSQFPKLKRSNHGLKRTVIAAAVLVGTGVAVALGWHYWSSHNVAQSTTVAMADRSIAVLPFVDMSEKKDQEYFGDGMAEEIIDLLVKIPGLKIISRTSSFQFKGRTEDLRSIGSQLGVAYVLEGSVRKSGDHLRVTAQLINAQNGTHLWSQTYDRDLSDVLKMQDEIAASLGRALQIEVGAGEFPSRPALRNTEAYSLYLQGQHASDRGDRQGLEQGLSDFTRALELDPTFAAAEVGLSDAYSTLGTYGFMPPAIAFEKARQAAERALTLDPNLTIAHLLLGEIHRLYDWDWSAAGREILQAHAMAPNDSEVLLVSAVLSANLGRWDEALAQLNASLAQDPLNPGGYDDLSQLQLRRGRLEEAEEAQRRALAISPTGTGGHYFLGLVLLARGEGEAALAEMLKEGDDQMRLGGSAMAYSMLGRKVDSDAALAQMIKSETNRPFFIASVHAFRGETDEALKWLDTAYTHRETALLLLKCQLAFDKLEGDPRYKAFLKKMNLPE